MGFSEEDMKKHILQLEYHAEQQRKDQLIKVDTDVAGDIQKMDQSQNMEHVNLFGLPLNLNPRDAQKSSKEL